LSFRPPTNTFEGRLWPESVCDILFVIPAQAGIQGKIKMVEKHPAVYILASKKNGTLYIGVTSDLVKRIWEHKNNLVEGFTKRYDVHHLVWYELHEEMASAID
jgi:hypothetical protein